MKTLLILLVTIPLVTTCTTMLTRQQHQDMMMCREMCDGKTKRFNPLIQTCECYE